MEALNLNMLEELEIEEYEQQPEEVKQRFRISDLNQASWAFRKIAAFEKKQEEIENLANMEISRIKEWKDREINSTQKSVRFFEGLLGAYLMELRELDQKAKVTTPYGTISTRKQKPQWKINDEELISWLKENNHEDLIRTKEEPALATIQTTFDIAGESVVDKATGELVAGIRIIEQDDKIVVKTK
jgi:phage host-nuclease inhibitor protein Gam